MNHVVLCLEQFIRIHERIVIDKDSIEKLKINFDRSFIKLGGIKHKCLIKDLFYGGAFVISFCKALVQLALLLTKIKYHLNTQY